MIDIIIVLVICVTIVTIVALRIADRMALGVDENDRCVAVHHWKVAGTDRCRLRSGHTGPHVVKQALVSGDRSTSDYWWDGDKS